MTEPLDRRKGLKFTELISTRFFWVAAAGAAWVLIDPTVTLMLTDGSQIRIGGIFSADLKGMVIGQIMISGYSAVREYWLGSSAGSQKQSDTLQRIVEDGAKVAPVDPKTDTVNMTAETVNVEEKR